MNTRDPIVERPGRATHELRAELLAGLPVAERQLELAGVRTAVLEGGAGSPIVLLHGPGEHATKWLRVIPQLASRHRLVIPDLPGHGSSGPIDGPIEPARVIAWLDELISACCATPPTLVGQIMGGAIAARYAARHGERLQGLVLVDALGLGPFRPAPEFAAALTDFIAQPGDEAHDRLWRRCAFDLDRLRDRMGERWQQLKAYNLDRATEPGLRATQHGLMEHFGFPEIPEAELARIEVPTLLIWGRHDLATPLEVARAASDRHGWPLHVIDEAADDPPIEQPEAFVTVLFEALGSGSVGDRTEAVAGTVEGRAAQSGQAVRDAWSRIAAGYDAFVTPTHLLLGSEGLHHAGLRAGMRFLDVAAGSGALSLPAARIGAHVLAIDHSPAMLERLAARARQQGLDLDLRVMDGQALDLEDGTFDVTGSQFGVMLFPDMPRGIREMVRVTRPGGRVLVTAFGSPARIEFLGFLVRAVQTVRPDFSGPPMDPPPLPFQLQDPDRLARELAKAGLTDVRVETTVEKLEFRSGAALWQWLTHSNPIVEGLLADLALTTEQRAAIVHALEDQVRARAAPGAAAVLTSPINIGVGTR